MKFQPVKFGLLKNKNNFFFTDYTETANKLSNRNNLMKTIKDFNVKNIYTLYNKRFFRLSYFEYKVPLSEEQRPDITSDIVYGDADFYWIILFFNRLKSIEDYKANIDIKIPEPSSLFVFLMENLTNED